MEELRYPIGRLALPDEITSAHVLEWIQDIEQFPRLLRVEVEGLASEQLEWKYRPGGWSIRQLIHHCADSHLNSQIRFKLALTEERPTIKTYQEDQWATLPDSESPISWSLNLLEALHAKWGYLLRRLPNDSLQKEYYHPERGKYLTLKWTTGLYAWHGRHHLAHIQLAKKQEGRVP